ncbi:MAG: hypothetical protein LBM77_02140 [Spirochaetaceae bacterium]|jgi:hypothetical protein|nr:hypothetical protein [Spirochaetaceae bacterium]
MYRLLRTGFLIVFIFSCIACSNEEADETIVRAPITAPLSREIVGFAVIRGSYTNLYAQPENSGSINGSVPQTASGSFLRKGAIVETLERKILGTDTKETWLFIRAANGNEGWIPETAARLFATKAQAETAAGDALK